MNERRLDFGLVEDHYLKNLIWNVDRISFLSVLTGECYNISSIQFQIHA